MQERRNSIALAMELRLSCTNPSIYRWLSARLWWLQCFAMELSQSCAKSLKWQFCIMLFIWCTVYWATVRIPWAFLEPLPSLVCRVDVACEERPISILSNGGSLRRDTTLSQPHGCLFILQFVLTAPERSCVTWRQGPGRFNGGTASCVQM